jgi:D-3-phosphoglycerate dehydrogenase / 2-oxoglutarate reductase
VTRIFLTHTPDMRANLYGDRALAGLRAVGEVTLHEGSEALTAQALAEAARDCQVIVSDRNTRGEAAVFERSPNLVAFLRCAVDIRNIDVPAATAQGVLVTQASAGFVDAVTELVFGLMVDLARGVSRSSAEYRRGVEATVLKGRQLSASTLGVIGYGAIGRRVAALGAFVGMRVLVADPVAKVSDAGIEQVGFEALLAASDFVACLAVANERTENLMNDVAFARMKRGAYFVNVSRGNLVDEAALARALDSGHLAGAAMDVGRAADQKPSLELARRVDVIATPHIGGTTPEAIEHQALETVAQAAEIVKGRAPRGAVNAAQASRLARLAR